MDVELCESLDAHEAFFGVKFELAPIVLATSLVALHQQRARDSFHVAVSARCYL